MRILVLEDEIKVAGFIQHELKQDRHFVLIVSLKRLIGSLLTIWLSSPRLTMWTSFAHKESRPRSAPLQLLPLLQLSLQCREFCTSRRLCFAAKVFSYRADFIVLARAGY